MKIVTINCTNCSGRGYHRTKVTEIKEVLPGLFKEVMVEFDEDCRECDGNGFIEISSEDN